MFRFALAALVLVGCGRLRFDERPDASEDAAGPLTRAPVYLKASNAANDDRFGENLQLSADGSTLVIGSSIEASSASGVNADQTDNSAPGAGAAYVFVWTGTTWTQQAYLKASNPDTNDTFSDQIAVSADGNTVAIGARAEASAAIGVNGNAADNSAPFAGAVYVFVRTGSMWMQQAYVKASNAEFGDNFGIAVALSSDGNTLAVGAITESSPATGINGDESMNTAPASGAAYVFVRTDTTWSQQAYVKASNTAPSTQFGQSVTLSGDGNTLAVGAMAEDTIASNSGAAYVFTRAGMTWSQAAFVKPTVSGVQDLFGGSVELSMDGSTLAVGAELEDSSAVGIDGDATSDTASESGAVYVFSLATNWAQQAYIKASNTRTADHFGCSVALSTDGSMLLVGARHDEVGASQFGGAAYRFVRTGQAWSQREFIEPPHLDPDDSFGTSLDMSSDGNAIAIGSAEEDGGSTGIGGDPTDNSVSASGAAFVWR